MAGRDTSAEPPVPRVCEAALGSPSDSSGSNRIKEGKNTLRWDKNSCQRLELNEARVKVGVLANNLLHMVRQFYAWGEAVKRSMELLIKRLFKVDARVSYYARRW